MSDETDEDLEASDKRAAGNGFRVITNPERKPPPPDESLKELLDDLRRSRSAPGKTPNDTGDTPDAG